MPRSPPVRPAGAVVNKKGELLGIIRGSVGFSSAPDYTFKDNSAIIVVSGSKNESGSLCYAIPVEQVRRVVEQVENLGQDHSRAGWGSISAAIRTWSRKW